MAAPTNAAKREESSCQLGAVHTWHKADLSSLADDVRSQGVKRTSPIRASRSENGPKGDVTLPALRPSACPHNFARVRRGKMPGLRDTRKHQATSLTSLVPVTTYSRNLVISEIG